MKKLLFLLLIACLLLAGCDQRTPMEKSLDKLFKENIDQELVDKFHEGFNAGYYRLP